jgi:hypothetical protein
VIAAYEEIGAAVQGQFQELILFGVSARCNPFDNWRPSRQKNWTNLCELSSSYQRLVFAFMSTKGGGAFA